ncbi:MAG: hypothetical protein QGG36_18315 [Pirellulaceae bacterium]|jgi:hypothetical protein|nr:hypothetical protein [Pirellulaceae bacterium]MDP7017765.1 hypothetical protein [Pirellulaceae bacterium]
MRWNHPDIMNEKPDNSAARETDMLNRLGERLQREADQLVVAHPSQLTPEAIEPLAQRAARGTTSTIAAVVSSAAALVVLVALVAQWNSRPQTAGAPHVRVGDTQLPPERADEPTALVNLESTGGDEIWRNDAPPSVIEATGPELEAVLDLLDDDDTPPPATISI